MAVKRMDLRPKKVKRLRIQPIRKINRFDEASRVIEAKELHVPANDEMLELAIGSLTLQIRPISPIVAQIHYAPDGPVFEEEIYNFCWKCEQPDGFRLWDSSFTNDVIAIWKEMTKTL